MEYTLSARASKILEDKIRLARKELKAWTERFTVDPLEALRNVEDVADAAATLEICVYLDSVHKGYGFDYTRRQLQRDLNNYAMNSKFPANHRAKAMAKELYFTGAFYKGEED